MAARGRRPATTRPNQAFPGNQPPLKTQPLAILMSSLICQCPSKTLTTRIRPREFHHGHKGTIGAAARGPYMGPHAAHYHASLVGLLHICWKSACRIMDGSCPRIQRQRLLCGCRMGKTVERLGLHFSQKNSDLNAQRKNGHGIISRPDLSFSSRLDTAFSELFGYREF